MHKTSYDFVANFAETLEPGKKVIDLGSFNVNGSYKPLFKEHEYIGVDIVEGNNVDVVMTKPYEIPFDYQSVDVIVCGNTLEHVKKPWVLALDMHRILKPGGYICGTVPFRIHEHKFPVDCWRILPDGIEVLFGDCIKDGSLKGFEIIENKIQNNDTLFLLKKYD